MTRRYTQKKQDDVVVCSKETHTHTLTHGGKKPRDPSSRPFLPLLFSVDVPNNPLCERAPHLLGIVNILDTPRRISFENVAAQGY